MRILIASQLSAHRYKTPEGYLICTDSILARTGKQTYTRDELFGDGDGNEIEVDRPEKEVFSDKTLASFENKPVTSEHPSEDVNPNNYNQYAVGFTRDIKRGEVNGQPVMLGTLVITDAEAIDDIESGRLQELSCGYDCDVTDGDEPCQTNIRGNHIALCERGRAGIARIVDSVKDAERLPAKIKNGIKRTLAARSTYLKNKDYDISELIKEIERYLYVDGIKVKIIRESIKGWYKSGDGYMRKDYIFYVDGYPNDRFMASLYADPNTWNTTELNSYFIDSAKDIDPYAYANSEEEKAAETLKTESEDKAMTKTHDETITEKLRKAQEWIDYDMKRYGHISGDTKSEIEKMGLHIEYDDGEFEVADAEVYDSTFVIESVISQERIGGKTYYIVKGKQDGRTVYVFTSETPEYIRSEKTAPGTVFTSENEAKGFVQSIKHQNDSANTLDERKIAKIIGAVKAYKDAVEPRFKGFMIENVEGNHRFDKNKLYSLNEINRWLEAEDRKAKQTNRSGDYDNADIDFVFDVNGKEYTKSWTFRLAGGNATINQSTIDKIARLFKEALEKGINMPYGKIKFDSKGKDENYNYYKRYNKPDGTTGTDELGRWEIFKGYTIYEEPPKGFTQAPHTWAAIGGAIQYGNQKSRFANGGEHISIMVKNKATFEREKKQYQEELEEKQMRSQVRSSGKIVATFHTASGKDIIAIIKKMSNGNFCILYNPNSSSQYGGCYATLEAAIAQVKKTFPTSVKDGVLYQAATGTPAEGRAMAQGMSKPAEPRFKGFMIEGVENSSGPYFHNYNKNKLYSLNEINQWLEIEDKKAYQKYGADGGYDKAFIDVIYDVNGKEQRVRGIRFDLADGVRYGKQEITITQQDIEELKQYLKK